MLLLNCLSFSLFYMFLRCFWLVLILHCFQPSGLSSGSEELRELSSALWPLGLLPRKSAGCASKKANRLCFRKSQ